MNAEIRIQNQCKRKFCAPQRLAKKNCKFLTGWKIKLNPLCINGLHKSTSLTTYCRSDLHENLEKPGLEIIELTRPANCRPLLIPEIALRESVSLVL